jgi:hypothetical protein
MLDELHIGDAKPWLRYVCTACKAENKLDLEALRLGSGNVGTDIIHLPACACGVVTFLNRTWDDGPEADDQHRRAVNSLAEYLKARARARTTTSPSCTRANSRRARSRRCSSRHRTR